MFSESYLGAEEAQFTKAQKASSQQYMTVLLYNIILIYHVTSKCPCAHKYEGAH
jgi:hypothetical protein